LLVLAVEGLERVGINRGLAALFLILVLKDGAGLAALLAR
jgi:hypothetical protein